MRWFLLWSMSLPAVAAEIAVVGVHDASLSLEEQEALLAPLQAAIELSGQHQALTGSSMQEALGGREELVLESAFLADGRRLLEDGRILYQQAQPEAALEVLEAAASSLAEGMSVCTSVRDLWETWMLLGTSQLALGQEADALESLSYAVALQSERAPDPAVFPPRLIEMYRAERELALGEAATITVVVDESVEGAEVRLDGRDVGTAPLTLNSVLPGDHYIHVRTADRTVGFRDVSMASGGERTVRVALGEPELGAPRLSDGGRTQQVAALYRGIGRQSRADLVLLVGQVESGMRVQLFDPVVDAFGAPIKLASDADTEDITAAVVRALSQLDARGRIPGEEAVHGAAPLDISANRLLARWLMTPGAEVEPTLPMPTTPPIEADPGPLDLEPREKKKWPVYVAAGVGGAVVIAGVTALAVVLGGRGATETQPGGTITVGPPQ